MRAPRLPRLVSILLALGFAATGASAQIDVTATSGNPGPLTYPTLQLAFAAVNNGVHKGDVVMAVTADTSETASAVLNASGSGAADYTSVAVVPSGDAPRTISGAIAGAPLLDLNGADQVTIDGLDVNGNSLTISNTAVDATAGTSTIRFQGDATSIYNTLSLIHI